MTIVIFPETDELTRAWQWLAASFPPTSHGPTGSRRKWPLSPAHSLTRLRPARTRIANPLLHVTSSPFFTYRPYQATINHHNLYLIRHRPPFISSSSPSSALELSVNRPPPSSHNPSAQSSSWTSPISCKPYGETCDWHKGTSQRTVAWSDG
jgi:hypothetical protein